MQWIPVTERLPSKNYQDCLCWVKFRDESNERVAICQFGAADINGDPYWVIYGYGTVLFWMPLPPAPNLSDELRSMYAVLDS